MVARVRPRSCFSRLATFWGGWRGGELGAGVCVQAGGGGMEWVHGGRALLTCIHTELTNTRLEGVEAWE